MRSGVVNQSGKSSHWRRGVWTFIKAQLSAQLASLTDLIITILLVKLLDLFYLYATFLGSVVGGMVNCAVNYKWVFQSDGCKKTHVALKYLLVWAGSILLNTWGTFALTEWLTNMVWINHLLGYYVDDTFIFCKVIVAILVAFFWNYYLQRVFVYRNHSFKGFWEQHIWKVKK